MKKLLLFTAIILSKISFGQSITVSGFENVLFGLLNPNGVYNLGGQVNGKNSFSRNIGYTANGCTSCSGNMFIEWNSTNSKWQFRFVANNNVCNFCSFATATYYTNTLDLGNSPPCSGWSGNITGSCSTSNPPDPPVISSNLTTVCSGTGINLTATGCSNTINWSDGATGANRNNVMFNGSLTLTATCNNGLASGNSNSIAITINPKPTLVITNPAAVSPPNTVDITAASVTTGSTLNGATLSYHTDQDGCNILPNPATISVSNIYYIKATTSNSFIDLKPMIVIISDCGIAIELQSTTDDHSSGITIKKTNETIFAKNKIIGNANVTYRSNKSITLDPGSTGNPGFKADAGVIFNAEIGGCN